MKNIKLKSYLVQVVVESVHEIYVSAYNESESISIAEEIYGDGSSRAVVSEVTKVTAQTS